MKVKSNDFVQLSQIAVLDDDLQTAVYNATSKAFANRAASMAEISPAHGEAIRQQSAAIKRFNLNNLPEMLEQAEANLQANGIHVLWAEDAAEACELVLNIAQEHQVKQVTKSKSMLTEEIALNAALEKNGIETIETDLGEYIAQLNEQPPSHIIAPVIHMSKESIGDVFERTINMPPTDNAVEMAHFAGAQLRTSFLTSDMGISGGNFVIAETGTLCLVTNEGNGRMVTSMPNVHVALVGIEKLIPTMEDYATLNQILPRSTTGQKLSVYASMINGPRREHETDGPQHVYVIFVDNGRSRIYATKYAEALACIRCGACLNACPVYRTAGGHSYGWVYSGPIGAVITPLITGLENASPLPYASSLCGVCKQVCPVNIDLPRMLLDLRHDLVEAGHSETLWNWGMKAWEFGMTSPTRYQFGGNVASVVTNQFQPEKLPGLLNGWTKHRSSPKFAKKSFRQQWRERKKGEQNDAK